MAPRGSGAAAPRPHQEDADQAQAGLGGPRDQAAHPGRVVVLLDPEPGSSGGRVAGRSDVGIGTSWDAGVGGGPEQGGVVQVGRPGHHLEPG
jgi:hypothetical protein